MSRKLYQFSISHYCEKSRWNLDAKGLAYQTVELLPLLHRVVLWRIGGGPTVPVLQDDDRVITDSTRIALYLDDQYPERRLIPEDPQQRRQVLTLEDQADDAGRHIRRFIYGHALQIPGNERVLVRNLPPLMRRIGITIAPIIRFSIQKNYRITPETTAKSLLKLRTIAKDLEKQLNHNPNRYLVGDTLTLADITAASVFAPLLGPANSPWEDIGTIPEAVANERQLMTNSPFGQWVHNRYHLDRNKPTQ